jgi:hypothetical protein
VKVVGVEVVVFSIMALSLWLDFGVVSLIFKSAQMSKVFGGCNL